jgi:hypothetical protein
MGLKNTMGMLKWVCMKVMEFLEMIILLHCLNFQLPWRERERERELELKGKRGFINKPKPKYTTTTTNYSLFYSH